MNLYYFYDSDGQMMGLRYNDVNYYPLRNLQGDVVALTDYSGNKVVEYVYDSWGKVESVTGSLKDTLGKDNPIRYRGYYYDEETGLYYLQSRYYDPMTKRYINADGYVSTGQGFVGKNMFSYCNNNPINLVDPSGCAPLGIFDVFDIVSKAIDKIQEIVAAVVTAAAIGAGQKSYDSPESAAKAFATSTYSAS